MSSLKDLASLIMVPSLYKDGELHTVKPLADEDIILHPDATGNHDGNDGTTDRESGNFTFSRGSNLAATRVDVNGLIEKGRENHLLQSNQFDTTWVNVNSSETSGQSGYDGSNNAWLLTKTAANGRIYQSVSTSGVQTFSLYAKANASNWISLWTNVGTSYFDLANGTKGSTTASTTIHSEMVSVGNGWYRCSLIFNTSILNVRIYPADGDLDTSGTSGSIYIQDAQLEAGLVATDYIETGASTAQAGILEDMPRLDYSGGASCPALLLEPQRTNLMPQSEAIDLWSSKNGVTTEANTADTLSPEGVYNATKLTATTTDPYIYQSINVTADPYTMSCYVKGVGDSIGKVGRILFWYVGTATGTQTSHDFTLTGDWQRIEATTTPTGAGSLTFRVDIPANTSVIGDEAYIYGIQVEQGSYPTSYIPTYGSSVTRSVDSCLATSVSDVIGQSSGTLFVDFITPDTDSYFINAISDGTNNNKVQIEYNTTANTIKGIVRVSATTSVDITATGKAPDTRYKAAIAYAENDFVFYVNGVKIGTDTSGSIPPSMSRIDIGTQVGTFFGAGDVNQMVLFQTKLTDSELAALTTI